MFTASLGIFLFGLIAAAGGGYIGAAIGANFGFVLTGFSVFAAWAILWATGSTWGFDWLAFGPFAGPHVMFAGGVAAAAYAYCRGHVASGKDVNAPLGGLGRQRVLFIGALFGVGGYLCQIGLSRIPWFGAHTDSVALTVVISALAARVAFGRCANGEGSNSIFDPKKMNHHATSLLGRIAPRDDAQWLPWQERWSYLVGMGLFFGAAAGAVSIGLGHILPAAVPYANSMVFAISAIIILFLIMGFNMPVQHHITNIAGLAAVKFMPVIAGVGFQWDGQWDSGTWTAAAVAIVVAGLFGILAGWVCEFFARLWYDRGTTHIDPPASAIWVMNTVVVSAAAIVS